MSHRRTPLLILLACLLTAAGFSLPWAVSAWQDRQTADQVALYETTPLAQADLVAHLKLAANGYHTVALSQASAAYLSESQAGEAAQAALQAMYEKGLFFFGQEDLFAPDRWTLSGALLFLAVGTAPCPPMTGLAATPQRAVQLRDSDADSDPDAGAAVVLWQCTFHGSPGERLELILDDTFRKMLAFDYRAPPALWGARLLLFHGGRPTDDGLLPVLLRHRPRPVCPAGVSRLLGYRFPFLDSQGEAVNLHLTSDRTYLDGAGSEGDCLVLSFNARGL